MRSWFWTKHITITIKYKDNSLAHENKPVTFLFTHKLITIQRNHRFIVEIKDALTSYYEKYFKQVVLHKFMYNSYDKCSWWFQFLNRRILSLFSTVYCIHYWVYACSWCLTIVYAFDLFENTSSIKPWFCHWRLRMFWYDTLLKIAKYNIYKNYVTWKFCSCSVHCNGKDFKRSMQINLGIFLSLKTVFPVFLYSYR